MSIRDAVIARELLPPEKGDRGERGERGEQGPTGNPGLTIVGPIGPPGADGQVGERGLRGPKGDEGPAGKDGADGRDGLDGRDGERGPRGPRGEKGEKGEQGPRGPAGPTGRGGGFFSGGGPGPAVGIADEGEVLTGANRLDFAGPGVSVAVDPVSQVAVVTIPGAGPGGGADSYYVHSQGTPATVWSVAHNLSKRPAVSVVDSAEEVVTGEVVYLSDNELELRFSAAFSGKAYLS